MNKKSIFLAAYLLFIFGSALFSFNLKNISAASSVNGTTLILYDAASGTIPSPPLMNFNDFPPGVALPTYLDGATVMDTTASGKDTYAGWVASGAITPGFPVLDRLTGFQVNFSIQVENESHANNHRAGFSLIILSQDTMGIELAFWPNEIWAQGDDNTGGLFRHSEGIAFATSKDLVDYQVTILDDIYTVIANAQPILTGPLRDYSNFEGFPDPYQSPNFLFLGDDTTSAESRIRISLLSVTGTEPIALTATSTSTSISSPSPSPTDLPTPLPSVIPLPSPTPESKGFEFCPSSGLVVMMIALLVIKRIGRVLDPPRGD
jgi:hypothetical protein